MSLREEVPTKCQRNNYSIDFGDYSSTQSCKMRLIFEDMYVDMKYSIAQMKEINDGLCVGIDVSVYAKPELTSNKMREIKARLIRCKFNHSVNISGNFTDEQMMLILFRKEKGLDYESLAKPDLSYKDMERALVELEIQSGLF